jgi:hypothetical protein
MLTLLFGQREEDAPPCIRRAVISQRQRLVGAADMLKELLLRPEQLEQVEVVMFDRMLVETWKSASDIILGMFSSISGTYVYRLTQLTAAIAMGVLVLQLLLCIRYWLIHTRLMHRSQRVATKIKNRVDDPLRQYAAYRLCVVPLCDFGAVLPHADLLPFCDTWAFCAALAVAGCLQTATSGCFDALG